MAHSRLGVTALVMALLAALALQGVAAYQPQQQQPLAATKGGRKLKGIISHLVHEVKEDIRRYKRCEHGGQFYDHYGYFNGLQCCDGSWLSSCGGGYSGGGSYYSGGSGSNYGRCFWQGSWYDSYSYFNGWQCCSGSWRQGSCDSSGRCHWEGSWYNSGSSHHGHQCCRSGSWSKHGC